MTAATDRIVIASGPAGTLSYVPAAERATETMSRKKGKAGRSKDRPRSEVERGLVQCANLLRALSEIVAHRRANGFKTRAAWRAALGLAAELHHVRLILSRAATVGGAVTDADMAAAEASFRRWAKRHIASASTETISTAWRAAAAKPSSTELALATIPRPRAAGARVDLRRSEWLLLRPWGLWPIDADDQRIAADRREAKRKAQAKRREGRNVRPHAQGDAAFCRAHGISIDAFKKRKAKGFDVLNAWLRSQGLPERHQNVPGNNTEVIENTEHVLVPTPLHSQAADPEPAASEPPTKAPVDPQALRRLGERARLLIRALHPILYAQPVSARWRAIGRAAAFMEAHRVA